MPAWNYRAIYDCGLLARGQTQHCHVTVWSKIGGRAETKIENCFSVTVPSPPPEIDTATSEPESLCAGCAGPVEDLNADEIRQMSWAGARKLGEHARFGTGQRHWAPIKIESATVQVVSGTLHRLTVIFGQSACVNTEVVLVKSAHSVHR